MTHACRYRVLLDVVENEGPAVVLLRIQRRDGTYPEQVVILPWDDVEYVTAEMKAQVEYVVEGYEAEEEVDNG